MSWRDFFKSSLVRQLELEVAYLRTQLDKQEITHAKRLEDAISYNQRLRDELERTRILLSPGLGNISLPHEQEEPAAPPDEIFKIPTGTPWQRTLAIETEIERKRGLAREAQQASERAKGATHGDERSGREEVPQRVESAPS